VQATTSTQRASRSSSSGSADVPARASRRCSTPGCPGLALAHAARCAHCTATADTARDRTARARGARWRQRRAQLLRAHPRCVDCGATATVADHAPRSRRALIADGVLDPDELRYLQARCKPCHDRRTALSDFRWGDRRVEPELLDMPGAKGRGHPSRRPRENPVGAAAATRGRASAKSAAPPSEPL
jgi:5-methylcytosine-specific restriction protein A